MDESRHGQRRHGEPGEEASRWQVAALRRPGQRHGERNGRRQRADLEEKRIDEEFADARPLRDNAFKPELATRTLAAVLAELAKGDVA